MSTLHLEGCARSVASQTVSGFSVFVGLSGPEEFRTRAATYLAQIACECPHLRWNLLDNSKESQAQFELLRHLLVLSD
jgi:hypothetical protein